MAGDAVRIRCIVERDAENRWLAIGLVAYRVSWIQLEGEGARRTHEVVYQHVPCEAIEAFCVVEDSRGRSRRASLPLIVACG